MKGRFNRRSFLHFGVKETIYLTIGVCIMILSKQDLEKLIFEEIDKMSQIPALNEEDGTSALPQEETDPTQQYVDWIVAINEASREAIQEIESGTEPYEAATMSRLRQLALGLTSEDFHHHFHG